jgi:hypothetical protein
VAALHAPPAPLLDEELIARRQMPETQFPDARRQLAHTSPPRPQAVSVTPDTHVVPSQQPAAHIVEPQSPVLASDAPDELLDAELPELDAAPLDELAAPDPPPLEPEEEPEEGVIPAVTLASPQIQGSRPLPSALQTW